MTRLPVQDVIKTLFSAIVDYAGLFPPAKLEMQAAMAAYQQHQSSSDRWALNRFVLPVSRLDEFISLLPQFSLPQWSLSLLLSNNVEADLEQILALHHPAVRVLALEVPLLSIQEIDRMGLSLPPDIEVFFEIPLNGDLEIYLATLQNKQGSSKAFAKIRTGGITPDAFPTVDLLSQFILACAQICLPFKATAGLHHPLRGDYRLSYESGSSSTTMHGFLNVVIAAALAYSQEITQTEVQFLLAETSIRSFQVQSDCIICKLENAQYVLTLAEIQAVRQYFFRSFGSCSFQEPIHDLQALNLL